VKSKLEALLAAQIRGAKLREPVLQLRFAPPRRWRFDFAWESVKIALEVHGGGWVQGRHNRPLGMAKDFEKANTAQLMGWVVLHATGDMVEDGRALDVVRDALEGVGSKA
jgi:very-short-patch-repair endonuclease